MKKLNTLELTKKLVSIPSYVGTDCDEKEVGEFIFQYLQQFTWLTVIKQPVRDGRFNVIAYDKYPTRILINGHIDTVQPKSDWITDPFTPTAQGTKLFGLGTTDMKGSIAALLVALEQFKQTRGVMILCYVDEEYDFAGTKEFIAKYKDKITPELILSLDGKDLGIGNGCRGLIEINVTVKGKSGHASVPEVGVNAISRSVAAVNKLIAEFNQKYTDKVLGKTSCNLAYMQGGLDIGLDSAGTQIFGKEGNNIADIANFVLDIRPAKEKVNAEFVVQLLTKFLQEEGLTLKEYVVRHDFGSWVTPRSQLKSIEQCIGKTSKPFYNDIGSYGYIDTQMLWKAFKKAPSLTFGAGEGGVAHKANEYVEIKKLERAEEILAAILQETGGGEIDHERI